MKKLKTKRYLLGEKACDVQSSVFPNDINNTDYGNRYSSVICYRLKALHKHENILFHSSGVQNIYSGKNPEPVDHF